MASHAKAWITPNCFLNPPNTLSNYVQGVSYMLYTYDLHHNSGRSPTVEKFNPQLIFHNSNTGDTKGILYEYDAELQETENQSEMWY